MLLYVELVHNPVLDSKRDATRAFRRKLLVAVYRGRTRTLGAQAHGTNSLNYGTVSDRPLNMCSTNTVALSRGSVPSVATATRDGRLLSMKANSFDATLTEYRFVSRARPSACIE